MPPKAKKFKRVRSKRAVDKKQDKRLKVLEEKMKEELGWIDSFYTETTVNRTPQQIARGRQTSSVASPFFSCGQLGTGTDHDHERQGLGIKALRVKGRITLCGRGSASGFPPDTGSKTGKNIVRLLGVIYATQADYNLGIGYVLQDPTGIDSHPCRAVDSFYRKNSVTKWKIFLDKRVTVGYNNQVSRVNFNYKIPEKYSKMTYDTASPADPETNVMVIYALSGIRDNTTNQTTIQATYRCTFVK